MEDDFSPTERKSSSDQQAWDVSLLFWRPSKLRDDEMEIFFPHLDGRWSRQTKAAMERSGAKGLDLNENWARVAQDWSCPACNRSKPDIFRLSANGILLAKIEEHHDHTRDFVGQRARQLFGNDWLKSAPIGASKMLDNLEELATSFSSEFICSECNAADGMAKTRLRGEIHSAFSFSPDDISSFIRQRPNAEHQIELENARAALSKRLEGFECRLALVDQVLQAIKAGNLITTRSTAWSWKARENFDAGLMLVREFRREAEKDERSNYMLNFEREFLARSVKNDSAAIKDARSATRSTVRTPSDAEFASYVDTNAQKKWAATPTSWSCPICARVKRDIIRLSNKQKWSGGIRALYEYEDEDSRDAAFARRRLMPGFQHKFIFKRYKQVMVCSDCSNVGALFGQRYREMTEVNFRLKDISECLSSASPNSPHEFDWNQLHVRASANIGMSSAQEALERHKAMVAILAQIYKLNRAQGHDAAIDAMAQRLQLEAAHLDDPDEVVSLCEWLLDERDRLDADYEEIAAPRE